MIEPTRRKLATIVSADVVGYSRLMGTDTLTALPRDVHLHQIGIGNGAGIGRVPGFHMNAGDRLHIT